MVCLTFKLDVEDTWEILFFWEPRIWRSYVAYSQWGLIWFVLLGQKIGYSSVSGVSRLRVNLCIAPMLLACFRTLNPISRRNYCFMRKRFICRHLIWYLYDFPCSWKTRIMYLDKYDLWSVHHVMLCIMWCSLDLSFFLHWERICKLLQGISINYYFQFLCFMEKFRWKHVMVSLMLGTWLIIDIDFYCTIFFFQQMSMTIP